MGKQRPKKGKGPPTSLVAQCPDQEVTHPGPRARPRQADEAQPWDQEWVQLHGVGMRTILSSPGLNLDLTHSHWLTLNTSAQSPTPDTVPEKQHCPGQQRPRSPTSQNQQRLRQPLSTPAVGRRTSLCTPSQGSRALGDGAIGWPRGDPYWGKPTVTGCPPCPHHPTHSPESSPTPDRTQAHTSQTGFPLTRSRHP